MAAVHCRPLPSPPRTRDKERELEDGKWENLHDILKKQDKMADNNGDKLRTLSNDEFKKIHNSSISHLKKMYECVKQRDIEGCKSAARDLDKNAAFLNTCAVPSLKIENLFLKPKDQASTNNNVAPHTTNAQTADNTNALADIPSIDYNNYAPALPFNNNMAPAYQYPCINPNINAPAPPSNQNTNAQEEQPADNNYAPAQPF